MPEIMSEYQLIHPSHYIQNINLYSFSKIIEVDSECQYFTTLRKEYFKDFYNFIIENDIDPVKGDNLLDYLEIFESNYVFMIFDLNELYDLYDCEVVYFLLDFIDLLDVDNKFKMFNDMYHSESAKFIIKMQHIPRNIGIYPIIDQKRENVLEYLTGYHYDFVDA